MNCTKVSELICDYIGDCLSPETRRQVDGHLQQCVACRAEVESAKSMVTCLGSLSSRQSPVDCWPGIKERIQAQDRLHLSWFGWLARPIFAAPALAAALLLAIFLLWPARIGDLPGRDPSTMPEYGQYITAHSRLQRQQAFTDPDVTFVAVELEKASVVSEPSRP